MDFGGTALQLADPLALTLLLAVAAGLVVNSLRLRRPAPGLLFPSIRMLPGTKPPLRARLRWLPVSVRFAALTLMVLALARPQIVHARAEAIPEGIDIVLATDVSGSMDEATFAGVKKIDAVRHDAKEFVSGLKNDRVGLVTFAGEAVIDGPLTLDYAATRQLIESFVDTQNGLTGGTAIGTGLATALNVLRDSQAHSKVVILLTDGENNSGDISPLDAAQIASFLGIRVYTIGAVGLQAAAGETVDEVVMRRMAEMTGGQYFRADDVESLLAIYEQIDQLEKSRVAVREFTEIEDVYLPLLLVAAALLFIEVALGATALRHSP